MDVLLVEDDNANCAILKTILEQKNHSVICTPYGNECVVLLKQDFTLFDIVILDIILPDFNGSFIIKHIRNILKLDIPILVVSACAMSGDKETFISLGADGYVSKPFDFSDFFKAFEEVSNKQVHSTF